MKLARLAGAVIALAVAAQAVEHGVPLRPMHVHISPEATSQRVGTVPRGREINILERSPGWLHVFVTTDQDKDVSGWIQDQGIVLATTPNGDRVLFGEAVEAESEAEKHHARESSAVDAGRLYMRLTEYFPSSPLAGEAFYRAADIKWQLDSADVMSRASAKEEDPRWRAQIDEEMMKQVKKKYPGTKWADLADYNMLDNKVCGDWKGESKCPEREAQMYADYASAHPKSPKAAEALYNAASREAALVDIYKTEGDAGKSAGAKSKAVALAQRLTAQYPENDYAPRAARLAFMVEQGMPTYGSLPSE